MSNKVISDLAVNIIAEAELNPIASVALSNIVFMAKRIEEELDNQSRCKNSDDRKSAADTYMRILNDQKTSFGEGASMLSKKWYRRLFGEEYSG